ncbi:MAG: hypothetical protein GF398_18305 [Chitinivibrionales bacterium]|nr:hypothetical protein [Chitinivibrionales bacterium]
MHDKKHGAAAYPLDSIMRTRPGKQAGMTLLDLVVAIVVAGILVTLVFGVYLNVTRGFRSQTKAARRVEEMILTKDKIAAAMSRVSTLKGYSGRRIEFYSSSSDTLHGLHFKSNTLLLNNEIAAGGLKSFQFDIENNDNRALISWDAEMSTGAWLGGATVVKLAN